jgi:alkanesulfonate monooxygenase SsuD/methylene tetrahydromethanopterin reductase-like flavin-dependent oxidoreductase (luciferase family)
MPNYTHPGVSNDRLFDRVVQQAQAAENAGFDLVTVMDHFYQIRGIGPETEPMLEAYSTLAALAVKTSRVKLGTLVTGVTYRNPAFLAKTVTTLDVISKGRAIMGIGAAWNDSEHAGYGYEFPPIKERMDRLDEALAIIKGMFTEQRTLRLLARYGDIGHWFGAGLEDLKRKKEIFERHCESEKRDPSEVLITVGLGLILADNEKDANAVLDKLPAERRAMAVVKSVPEAAELIGEYMDAGFGGFTFNNTIYSTPESIARAGELIKTVKGSRVAAPISG